MVQPNQALSHFLGENEDPLNETDYKTIADGPILLGKIKTH